MDFAGIVEEIGEDAVTDLSIGDRAMALIFPEATRGAYASHIVVSPRSVTRAPTGMSDLAAATLPMTGLTAVASLDLLGLAPGSVLGVTGAAGVYGGHVIHLAKHRGLSVIADAPGVRPRRRGGTSSAAAARRSDTPRHAG
nr:hypothetical protein [Microbacterium pygmaeum]